MLVNVQCEEGRVFYIKVDKNEKISAVKTRIGNIEGVNPEEMELMSGLEVLGDDRNISYYNSIRLGSTLKCCSRYNYSLVSVLQEPGTFVGLHFLNLPRLGDLSFFPMNLPRYMGLPFIICFATKFII